MGDGCSDQAWRKQRTPGGRSAGRACERDSATSMIQPGSNSGPSFAAVAIAVNNDPAVLGAVTAIIFIQIVVTAAIGTLMGSQFGPADEASDAAAASEAAPARAKL